MRCRARPPRRSSDSRLDSSWTGGAHHGPRAHRCRAPATSRSSGRFTRRRRLQKRPSMSSGGGGRVRGRAFSPALSHPRWRRHPTWRNFSVSPFATPPSASMHASAGIAILLNIIVIPFPRCARSANGAAMAAQSASGASTRAHLLLSTAAVAPMARARARAHAEDLRPSPHILLGRAALRDRDAADRSCAQPQHARTRTGREGMGSATGAGASEGRERWSRRLLLCRGLRGRSQLPSWLLLPSRAEGRCRPREVTTRTRFGASAYAALKPEGGGLGAHSLRMRQST